MRTFTVAVATALLLWACIALKAQRSIKHLPHGTFNTDTAASIDFTHTKKSVFKPLSFQNPSTALGHPAGKKLAGNSKREADSLQQIILLRKKF